MMAKSSKTKITVSRSHAKKPSAVEKRNISKNSWSKINQGSPENRNDLATLLLHAESARNSGKFALSHQLYTEIIQREPNDIRAFNGRGIVSQDRQMLSCYSGF